MNKDISLPLCAKVTWFRVAGAAIMLERVKDGMSTCVFYGVSPFPFLIFGLEKLKGAFYWEWGKHGRVVFEQAPKKCVFLFLFFFFSCLHHVC